MSPNETNGMDTQADFAKAWQELAQGERTATALENHLTSLEKKIDELLAQADEDQKNLQSRTNGEKSTDAEKSEQSKP